jgi:hypothetical protein
METLETGQMLNDIGQQVAAILGKVPTDAYVYIEAGDQWNGGAIFDNLPNQLVYHEFDDALEELVERLWEAAPPDKKWTIIHYDIKDGHFEAEFVYTDDMELDPFEHDYRQDALEARYGSKEVIYPPLEDGDWEELTEEDLKQVEVIEEKDWHKHQ